jgi:guanidinopropionase
MTDQKPSFKPVSGNVLPRFAGIATFMRLPYLSQPEGVDIGLIGVPWDGGTTNRAGARHGPRQIRDLSTMVRNVHHVSGIKPFELCNCADLGDTPVNPIDLADSLQRIEDFFARVHDGHPADHARDCQGPAARHGPLRCPHRHLGPLLR